MNARLQLLRAEIASDRQAFELQLEALDSIDLSGEEPDAGDVARAAVALHHAYGAVEGLLHRVSRVLGGEPIESSDWHQALIHSMTLELEGVRPAVLSHDSASGLRQLLAFRHFFRHAYGVSLDPAQLDELSRVAIRLAEPLRRDLDTLDQHLRAAAEHEG